MKWYNTCIPYKKLEHEGIQYSVCRDFDHISRYRNIRQLIHCPDSTERFVALETPNPFKTNDTNVSYYEVPYAEENRLDVIAHKWLGNSNYKWIIAYFNGIEDGFTVLTGQKLKIPNSIFDLFNKNEMLSAISPHTLNLGSE